MRAQSECCAVTFCVDRSSLHSCALIPLASHSPIDQLSRVRGASRDSEASAEESQSAIQDARESSEGGREGATRPISSPHSMADHYAEHPSACALFTSATSYSSLPAPHHSQSSSYTHANIHSFCLREMLKHARHTPSLMFHVAADQRTIARTCCMIVVCYFCTSYLRARVSGCVCAWSARAPSSLSTLGSRSGEADEDRDAARRAPRRRDDRQ
jgi:hypothetical protein